jgi:hypothetical protein
LRPHDWQETEEKSGANVPAAQGKHGVLSKVRLLKRPGEHGSQVVEPSRDAKVPIAHGWQSDSFLSLYLPGAHKVHEPEPMLENFPAGQCSQEEAPHDEA